MSSEADPQLPPPAIGKEEPIEDASVDSSIHVEPSTSELLVSPTVEVDISACSCYYAISVYLSCNSFHYDITAVLDLTSCRPNS
ncbi:hypothetical protein ACLOJK_025862 [Asimina triloba]